MPIHYQSIQICQSITNLSIEPQLVPICQSINKLPIQCQSWTNLPILRQSANLPIHQSSATRRQITQFNASSTHHQSTNLSPIYDQPTRSINPPSRIIHPTVKTDDTQVIPSGTRSATVVPIPDQSESQTHIYQR